MIQTVNTIISSIFSPSINMIHTRSNQNKIEQLIKSWDRDSWNLIYIYSFQQCLISNYHNDSYTAMYVCKKA
jgi:hypothetical protein